MQPSLRTMPLLPVETWEEIFRTHLGPRDWISLSTTSSLFRAIAQAALFEDVVLSRTLGKSDDVPENRTLALFVRALEERPALGGLIHALHIGYDVSDTSLDVPRFDLYARHPVLEHLALLSALRRLTVENFLIDPHFYAALRAHPRLNSVEFLFCSAVSQLPIGTEALGGSSIASLTIKAASRPVNALAWAAVLPTGLRSLTLGSNQDPAFIDTVLCRPNALHKTKALTTLRIGSTSSLPPSIITLLTSSLQIRRLSLGWSESCELTYSLGDLPQLPVHAIPFLEDFTGPASFVGTFVRGRPVHTVKLMFARDTPVDVLSSLQLSSVCVKRLEVPSQNIGGFLNRDKDYLSYAPSTISCFCWSGFRSEKDNAKLYLQSLSTLKELSVVRCHLSSAERTKFVQKYSEACPSIREFDFWKERWLARGEGGWERYLSQ